MPLTDHVQAISAGLVSLFAIFASGPIALGEVDIPLLGTIAIPRGVFLAAAFASISSFLAVQSIIAHLSHYVEPRRQRYVIRILLMVPIYGIDSLWGILVTNEATWVCLARDTYESYVIFNFFHLLLDFMGGEEATIEYWKNHSPTMDHMFPLRGKMNLDARALRLWKFFLMQYMILSPLLTLVAFAAGSFSDYNENSWSLENVHTYVALGKCVSVTFSFTALVYFYFSVRHHLHDQWNPTAMFISIKAVIFLGCWQGFILMGLVAVNLVNTVSLSHLFSNEADAGADEVLGTMENFLVCVEMLGAAIAHHFVFHPSLFRRASAAQEPPKVKAVVEGSFGTRVLHAFSVGDVAKKSVESTKGMTKKDQ